MGKMDWGKANRAAAWRASERDVWSGHLPDVATPASEKQLRFLAALMAKAGRRPHTEEEIAQLSMASASRLIKQFTERN